MALPTNINVGVIDGRGAGDNLNYTGKGVRSATLHVIPLIQGTDLGAGLTGTVAAQAVVPFKAIVRHVYVFSQSCTGTDSALVYNSTQAANVIASQTLTSGAGAAVTTITTSTINEGDVIQLQLTTQATTGAAKGTQAYLLVTILADSSSNQFL